MALWDIALSSPPSGNVQILINNKQKKVISLGITAIVQHCY